MEDVEGEGVGIGYLPFSVVASARKGVTDGHALSLWRLNAAGIYYAVDVIPA